MTNYDHLDLETDESRLLTSAYDHEGDSGLLERKSCAEEKSRWLSIRLIYMTSFMNYVSFTITLASLWAYLKVLEPKATASTLGWVVSAYAMGQIVSGPLFGFWANRRTIKEPLVVSLGLNLVAYVFYMYLANLPSHRGYYMVASRLLIGFSSGTVPLSRAYVANATSQSERTSAIANTNIFGAVGFILGPLLQAALVPISYPGPIESMALHFNMYTAPILLSTVVTLINVVVITLVFKEHKVSEIELDGTQSSESTSDGDVKIDYLAAVMCIVFFFSSFLNFAFLETVTMPLIMHMFTWNKAKATLIQSFVIGGTALLSIPVYVVIKILSSRMREKTLLLCGFIVSLICYLTMLPWGNDHPDIQAADIHNVSTVTSNPSWKKSGYEDSYSPSLMSLIGASNSQYLSLTVMTSHNETSSGVGCPWQYSWCQTVPALKLPQYIVAMLLFGIGYPITNVMTISIFSKILGPKPMGLWMGCLIASGCLSGILGPIMESSIYDQHGPRVSFITLSACMVATIMLILFVFKRLVPFSQRQKTDNNYSSYTSINKG